MLSRAMFCVEAGISVRISPAPPPPPPLPQGPLWAAVLDITVFVCGHEMLSEHQLCNMMSWSHDFKMTSFDISVVWPMYVHQTAINVDRRHWNAKYVRNIDINDWECMQVEIEQQHSQCLIVVAVVVKSCWRRLNYHFSVQAKVQEPTSQN